MEPLPTTKQVFTWLCIYCDNGNISPSEKFAHIICTFNVFAFNACISLASVAFIVKNISSDLENSLTAVFQIAVFSGVLYVITAAVLLRHRITALFGGLQTIYDESSTVF